MPRVNKEFGMQNRLRGVANNRGRASADGGFRSTETIMANKAKKRKKKQ